MRRLLLALVLSFSAFAVQATTYTVNDLGDGADATPGDDTCATAGAVCTLRAAIMEANAHAGGDAIQFSVTGTIAAGSAYPSIVQPTAIDASMVAGVVVNGGGAVPVGFHLAAGSSGSLIDSLEIVNFSATAVSIDSNNNQVRRSLIGTSVANMDGVAVFGTNNTIGGTNGNGNVISGNQRYGVLIGGNDNTVRDNIIGLDAGGMAAMPNGEDGVHVFNLATGNVIGSLTANERNVISGNGDDGVDIDNAPSNSVYGNYIGTDATGAFGIGNGDNGVELNSNTNTVGNASSRNLISGNTFSGVAVVGGTGNVIAGNDIGVDAAGTAAISNEVGVTVSATGTTVGTTTARNVISGNFFEGIVIEESFATVQNNIVGLDAAGTTIIGNGGDGIFAGGSITNLAIGGLNANEGNVASGNGGAGIGFAEGVENSTIHGNIVGLTADGTDTRGNGQVGIGLAFVATITVGTTSVPNIVSGNSSAGIFLGGGADVNIVGNRVGTNAAGTAAQSNLDSGIVVAAATNTLVSNNLVSANGFYGIEVTLSSSATTVTNNLVGTAIDGTTALGNFEDGINVCDSVSGTVIGNASGGANVIAFNGGPGIGVEPTALLNNAFIGNSIHDNDGLGIDLEIDGITANDALDADTGANNLQNFPTISTALRTLTTSHAGGTIQTEPNSSVTLHFYASPAADPSGNGEGQSYLGQQTVVTDGAGNAPFAFNGPAIAPGSVISATATIAANGTSEFSNALPAGPAPTVQFSTSVYPAAEGSGFVTITVMRSGDLTLTSTVDYATSPGTATAGADYTHTAGTLTFLPTEDTKTFNVPIVDDLGDEPLETVNLTLSNPTVATLGEQSTAVIQIADNDNPPSLIISDVAINEGTGTTTNFVFTVTPSAPSAFPITVDYATADGTATAPSDYAMIPLTTLTIPANQANGQFTVTVGADAAPEGNETFFVNLSNPTNATIADSQGQGTIQNDDGVPSITIGDVSLSEGNAGTTLFTFNVNLSGTSGSPITVDYATANGTAIAGSDYTAIPTTQLTFAPGVQTMPVTVSVLGDTTFEPNETFLVNLTNPNGATIADNQGLGTILNDDVAPPPASANISIAKTSGSPTFDPGQPIVFTITVANSGPDSATGVTVTDILPPSTTFVSANATQGSCTGTTTVTCTLGTLANAAIATITLTVTANGTAPISNTATVLATEGDPAPLNNTATAVVNPASSLTPGNIPTLSEWALLLLAAALALAAAMKMRC